MNSNLRIVFLGTPDFAVEGLKKLVVNNYNIVGVVTAPDKPAGRGKKISQSAIKIYANEQNLNILQPTNLKNEAFIAELKLLKADLQIIVAFRMLPEVVWNMPKYGTFNLHASLLPQYRGAAPINWAIINGETKTGVTTFFLQHEIDTGNIILQEDVQILETDNAETLHDKLMILGGKLILETVQQIEKESVNSITQQVTTEIKLAPKIFKENTKIDWNKSSVEIHNFVRGLSPYPTAWTILDGKILKIYKTELNLKNTLESKQILTDFKTFLKIKTLDGYLSILELQLEGKKRMDISEFLRGYNGKLIF
jgi:methionyl-tRNA formyltransferase